MTKKAPSPACLALQDNVLRLIALSGKSRSAVARESRVALRTLNYIVNDARGSGVDTVERIADYFELPSWLLLLRELPTDASVNKQLVELVTNFLLANPADKNNIVNIAKRAAEVSAQLNAKQPQLVDADNKLISRGKSGDIGGGIDVSNNKLPRKKATK